MKKFITLFATVALLLVSHICQGQIHFSKTANVYDDSNNAKVGQQYIAANITKGSINKKNRACKGSIRRHDGARDL